MNSFGVAVSSTETIESSEAALAFDPLNNATGVSCIGLHRASGKPVLGGEDKTEPGRACWLSASAWLHSCAAVPPPNPPPSWRPSAPKQITEDDVASIILPLPTATSARQAAAALGEAIEENGSAEGFGILFSDTGMNAWVSVKSASRGPFCCGALSCAELHGERWNAAAPAG